MHQPGTTSCRLTKQGKIFTVTGHQWSETREPVAMETWQGTPRLSTKELRWIVTVEILICLLGDHSPWAVALMKTWFWPDTTYTHTKCTAENKHWSLDLNYWTYTLHIPSINNIKHRMRIFQHFYAKLTFWITEKFLNETNTELQRWDLNVQRT